MPSRHLCRALLGVLLVCLACAPKGAPAPAAEPLLASVQANTTGDSVHFVLQVTNTSTAPVELNFSSAQRFDFSVERDGRNVWTWSADRMFAQALGTETLAAGETRRYEATWRPGPGTSGEYVVTGTLTSSDHGVEQSTRFRL